MHLEKYSSTSFGENGDLNQTSAWINKMKTTLQVVETDETLSWMLLSGRGNGSGGSSSGSGSSEGRKGSGERSGGSNNR